MLTRNCTQRMNAGIKARLVDNNTLAIYFVKPNLIDVNGIKYERSSDLEIRTTASTTVEVQSDFYPNNAYQRIGYDDYSEVSDKVHGDAYSFLWIGTGDTKETMYDYKLSIDVDKNEAVSMQYRIQSVPTFMLFKNGEAVWRQSGTISLNDLKNLISQHL